MLSEWWFSSVYTHLFWLKLLQTVHNRDNISYLFLSEQKVDYLAATGSLHFTGSFSKSFFWLVPVLYITLCLTSPSEIWADFTHLATWLVFTRSFLKGELQKEGNRQSPTPKQPFDEVVLSSLCRSVNAEVFSWVLRQVLPWNPEWLVLCRLTSGASARWMKICSSGHVGSSSPEQYWSLTSLLIHGSDRVGLLLWIWRDCCCPLNSGRMT